MGDEGDPTQGYDGGPSFSEARKAFLAKNAAAAAAASSASPGAGDKPSFGSITKRPPGERKPIPSTFDSPERKTGGLQGLKAKTSAARNMDDDGVVISPTDPPLGVDLMSPAPAEPADDVAPSESSIKRSGSNVAGFQRFASEFKSQRAPVTPSLANEKNDAEAEVSTEEVDSNWKQSSETAETTADTDNDAGAAVESSNNMHASSTATVTAPHPGATINQSQFSVASSLLRGKLKSEKAAANVQQNGFNDSLHSNTSSVLSTDSTLTNGAATRAEFKPVSKPVAAMKPNRGAGDNFASSTAGGNKQDTGFRELTNQIRRKFVRKGFRFNLLVVGQSGLGKSTFVNTLFYSSIYSEAHPQPHKRVSKTVTVQEYVCKMTEGDVNLELKIVDTPGFGEFLNNTNCAAPIVKYIEKQYDEYMNIESRVNRDIRLSDPRVHCCLYFISPNGPHRLRTMDIETMKALQHKVNLVPIIAKADSFTAEELSEFKAMVKQQLQDHEIVTWNVPDLPEDDELCSENREHKDLVPFAICASLESRDGPEPSRFRKYPFGVVEVENSAHNDFTALRSVLVRCHLADLVEVTNDDLYEKYRSEKLSAASAATAGPDSKSRSALSKNPMSILEEEKKQHDEKMKKMEADMAAVFQQKVQEKERKLRQKEEEMIRKHDEMTRNLESQSAALRAAKEQHAKNVQAWTEAQNSIDAASAAAAAEQANSKDKKKKLFNR